MAALEIETLVPPVFVTVADKDWFEPTVTFPKLKDVGLELSCPGVAVPVPDNDTVRVGFEALDEIVTVPLAAPVVVGANFTVNVVLCPAFTVSGVLMPLSVNPIPLIVADEIVTFDPPVLVTVADRDWFDPTVTFPKLRVVGFELRVPGVVLPVPDSATVRVGFEALEEIVTVPLAVPDVVGANLTVNVVLWPAFKVSGVVIPLSV